ncbi:MAG: single-stranded-DNA-specific exonuclease RecJ [Armatimonadota bacterium]|nr:single-stranded-DNA-specific exonuclease RecJ [Armatimonadota bacterium]MDR7451918.1 single-stranded-DNA-specific exonuclease RecJ [Armatimonadota bacterium]MDR7466600.1 single-stranded-DNA-specific exonuclease RecJ [Armatimonadota bacterium]MDR7492926.1 single-stranded-DNA-specific exonuclease RecJ [Armatimonadota bacterium]MDR7500323.1 single-stranded-DNA-specific exonuclease RecJ [Armatimonadota bacterium]
MAAPRWHIAAPTPRVPDLAAALGISPITAQVLVNRGYTDPSAARRFLDAPLEELCDPEAIPGTARAADRLVQALRDGEPLTVYGDYDADGVTATAILVRGLEALGGRVGWFVPSRFVEGYGLQAEALERIRRGGGLLVVAVDCGVTAVEEIRQAGALGQEIIVVDHHEPSEVLPPALAVIAPKAGPARPPFGEYAAAGLAFQLLRAVRRRMGQPEMPEDALDLAALGTIADLVPLTGDNRILARAGLHRMQRAPSVGIAALIRAAGLSGELTARHVGYALAPRLNAAGRLGDAGRAVRLLLSADASEAEGIAATLDAENRARQQLCDQILTQAVEEVEGRRLHHLPAIVLAKEGWHPGVIGIVASQLVERYYRPVVVVAVEGGTGRGSARSIPAFPMVDGLASCADLLLRYGGHAMAAGLTIEASRIEEFARRFTEAAGRLLRPDDLLPTISIDADTTLAGLTESLAREFARLAPFGNGNPEPVLALRGIRAVSTRVMGDGVHLRLGLTDGEGFAEAVGFRLGDASELLAFTRARIDLAFTLSLDLWDGRPRLQLVVRDLQTPGVDLEAVLTDGRLLVDRLFARAEDYLGDGALGLEEAEAFYTKVVGVTYEGRQEVVRMLRPGDALRLRREPANPVDPHAIGVLTDDGRQVGYLSARVAARVAPSMDAGARYTATVTQVTGGPTEQDAARSFGVNVCVQRREASGDERDPGRLLSAGWRDLPAEALLDRLRIHLRRGTALSPAQTQAVLAVLEGRAVLAVFGPGRGRAAVVAQAAAAFAVRRGGPVAIALPLCGQVERLHAALTPPLDAIGLRCASAHGAQPFRRRQRLLQVLDAGAADVVVASLEFLRHPPPTLHPALVILEADPVCDAAAFGEALDRLGRPLWSVFSSGLDAAGLEALRALAPLELLGEADLRTNLRLVDRRGERDRLTVLVDAAARADRTLVRVTTREGAVSVARELRGRGVDAAYCHGGLPLRVREVLAQAFADGRIPVLVAADGWSEDAASRPVPQVILAGLPPDRGELLEWIGSAGAGGRPATVVLLYGRDDLQAVQAALAERHPTREVLAAIFRAVRERLGRPGGAAWPDDDLAAALGPVTPSRRTIGVGLDVLAEAGVIAREYDGERWRLSLPDDGGRRDLSTSLRYTEGNRAMREAGELARLAFGPLPDLLRAAAGGGREVADRPERR